MKKTLSIISTALITAMATASIANAAAFSDTDSLNETQLNILNNAVDNGIITGYEDGTVRPFNTLTRAEFAAILCRYMGYSSSDTCSFSDASSHWAGSYIQACVDKGAINGIGNNLFDPEAPVTFYQASKIVTVISNMTNGFDLDSLGGYPLAYLTVGQNGNLYNNLTYGFTGEDYSLSRIDAIAMISNAGLGTTASEQNTTVDTEGKEVMTSSEVEAYVPTNGYGQFSNFGIDIQEKMSEITLNAFKKMITSEFNIHEAENQIMREINDTGLGSDRTNLLKKSLFALNKALKNFSSDGHHKGNIIIVD